MKIAVRSDSKRERRKDDALPEHFQRIDDINARHDQSTEADSRPSEKEDRGDERGLRGKEEMRQDRSGVSEESSGPRRSKTGGEMDEP